MYQKRIWLHSYFVFVMIYILKGVLLSFYLYVVLLYVNCCLVTLISFNVISIYFCRFFYWLYYIQLVAFKVSEVSS